MRVRHLYSISEIKPEDCIQTGGSRPVKVFCSDLEYYICKYFEGTGMAFSLFNELISAAFLKLWQLPVPDFAFVKIKEEHILQTGYPKHWFDKPAFGSSFRGHCKEVDMFFQESPLLPRDHPPAYHSFLKIGLFDIWISNEDRNFNNTNLLFDPEKKIFIPIDHVQIFNGNNLGEKPALITPDESILTSPLLKRLFSRNLQKNISKILTDITDDFYKYTAACHYKLNNILALLPEEWLLDPSRLRSGMAYLFTDKWKERSLETFHYFIQKALNT